MCYLRAVEKENLKKISKQIVDTVPQVIKNEKNEPSKAKLKSISPFLHRVWQSSTFNKLKIVTVSLSAENKKKRHEVVTSKNNK